MGNNANITSVQTEINTPLDMSSNMNKQQQDPIKGRKIHKQATRSGNNPNIQQPSYHLDANYKQSLELKNQGNKQVSQNNYKLAIECYSKAISLYDKDSIYFSNRAVAYRHLNQIPQAKEDAIKAIQRDKQNARAHFILGTIILIMVQQSKQFGEELIQQAKLGLNSLEEAHKLLYDNNDQQKQKLKSQVQQNIGKGKRLVFLIAKEMDVRNCNSLLMILNAAAKRTKKEQLINVPHIEKAMQTKSLQDITVPDYFCCVITQELMKEPILFNTGHTYEKESIINQVRSNGPVDPNSRKPLNLQTALINTQVQQGIQEIKGMYGWLGIESEQIYQSIIFE